MNGEHGELYKTIIDMEARLSDKIDHLGERMSDRQKTDCEDTDSRIDKLEQFIARRLGRARKELFPSKHHDAAA